MSDWNSSTGMFAFTLNGQPGVGSEQGTSVTLESYTITAGLEVLEGSVAPSGSSLVITAEVLCTVSGHSYAGSYEFVNEHPQAGGAQGGSPGTGSTGSSGTGSTGGTGTGSAPGGTTSSAAKAFPCSTRLLGGTCSVGTIQLAGGPFNAVAALVPRGTVEYEQLRKLGVIPVSGECLQPCVLTVEALLKHGKLATGSAAHTAPGHPLLLGKVRLKITYGVVAASLRISATGRKILKRVKAKHFEIELRISAKTPTGKTLGRTRAVDLSVARGKI